MLDSASQKTRKLLDTVRIGENRSFQNGKSRAQDDISASLRMKKGATQAPPLISTKRGQLKLRPRKLHPQNQQRRRQLWIARHRVFRRLRHRFLHVRRLVLQRLLLAL